MSKILRYEEIMSAELANMIARQDKVTDFNEGSVIHTILDTVARVAERAYVAIRQGYNDMLRSIPYSAFKFYRKKGTIAAGTVIFSRSSPIETPQVVPRDTIVSGGGLKYTTTEPAIIGAFRTDSQEVGVAALEVGSSGNIPPATISNIDSVVDPSIVGVRNDKPFTGGTDIEGDTAFEERFKAYLAGLSGTNAYSIKEAALSIPEVRSCSIQNHKPLLHDIYNATIYIDDGSGNASEAILEKVRAVIQGDGTSSNPGHLAPGINCRIVPPAIVPIDVTARIVVLDTDTIAAKGEIEALVIDYINSLSVGTSFIIAELIARIMELVYVKDVVVSAPTTNYTVTIGQILRAGTIDISLTTG